MATQSRLSMLFEGLLISTLLLSLSFTSCNATSRNMESMNPFGGSADSQSAGSTTDSMANSCRGRRSCRKPTAEQDLGMMHQNIMHMSSMDSDAAEAKTLDPVRRMSDHDESLEWVGDSQPKGMMDAERLRDTDTVREDQTIRNSERMRDLADEKKYMGTMRGHPAHRMSDSGDTMSDMDRKRGPQRLRDSEQRMSVSEREGWNTDERHIHSDGHSLIAATDRMRDSDRMSSDSERIRDSDRMSSDSDRMSSDSDRKMKPDRMRDSERMMESDRMGDSHRMMDTDSMRDSHRMMDADRMRDASDIVIDSDKLRDSHTMVDSDQMIDSQGMIDSDQMRDLHWRTHSNNMRDSERTMASERMGKVDRTSDGNRFMDLGRSSDSYKMHMRDPYWSQDSENVRTSHKMSTMNHETTSASEDMQSSERINWRDSDLRSRDSNQMTDMERISARNSERRNPDLGSSYDQESEMMRDSDRIRASRGRRDLENTRSRHSYMKNSAAAERHPDHLNGEKNRGSEMMRDLDRNMALDGRRDLEITREGNNMMDSTAAERHTDFNGENAQHSSDMIGDADNQMTGFNKRGDLERRRDSGQMRDSDTDQSRAEHMERRHADHDSRVGSHMGRQRRASTMEPRSCHGANCDAPRLSSRRLDAKIIDSSRPRDLETIDSSSSSSAAEASCSKMNAAHCDVVRDGQLQASQQIEMSKGDSEGLSHSDCRLNHGADCTVTPDPETSNHRSTEHIRSTKSGKMSSCNDDRCRNNIASEEEANMAGATISERMHGTQNDQEIVASPKLMKLSERRTAATITSTKRLDSENMANPQISQSDSQSMSSADAETMQVSNERHLLSIAAEKRSSNMDWEMAHSTSNHRSTAEIHGQYSCAIGANCRSTSGIMHMSSRDSEMMGHNDEGEMNHTGSKSLEHGGLMIDQESVEDSQMMRRESNQMTNSAEMASESSKVMHCNHEETKADSLPIHDHN